MSSRILAVALLSVGAGVPAQAQEWVGVYNPTQVLSPLSETALHAFLTNVEPQVAFALAEDPDAGFTPATVAAHFDGLRNWVTDRIAIVLNQVSENVPAPRP